MIAAAVSIGGTRVGAASLTRDEGSVRLPEEVSRSRVWKGE